MLLFLGRFKLRYLFKALSIYCLLYPSMLQASYYSLQSQSNNPLHQAASNGNLEEVIRFLRNPRLRIDSMTSDGYTALHLAVKKDHLEVARTLLQHGANVDATVTRSGNTTALDLAMKDYFFSSYKKKKAPNIEMVKLLLKYGAAAGERLHTIVSKGDIEMAKFFLKHSTRRNLINELSPHSKDTLLLTALHTDTGRWRVTKSTDSPLEMVKLLLEHGADVNKSRTYSSDTPLHMAVHGERSEVVELLLQKKEININAKNKDLKTPLHLAAGSKLTNVVAILLTKKALVNEQDKDGKTALHLAVQGSTRSKANKQALHKTIQLLIEAGADIHIQDKEEKTALHYTVKNKDEENTKLLISKQASINAIDKENCTPLNYVFTRGYHYDNEAADNKTPIYNIASELLINGAEVNTPSKDLSTPLHQALRYPHPKAATLLIERGADVNALDNKGESPLYLAVVNEENHVLLENLLKRGAHDNKCFEIAWNKRWGKTVKLLLDNGIIPQPFSTSSSSYSSENSKYSSPLEEAVKRKDWRITKYLLEYGAPVENHLLHTVLLDLELKKDLGLKKATDIKNQLIKDITEALAEHPSSSSVAEQQTKDLSSNRKNRKQAHPSFEVKVKKELKEIIVLLLQHGANPNAIYMRQLPLEIAFERYGQPVSEIISMLRSAGANLYAHTAKREPFIQTLKEKKIKKYLGDNASNTVPSLQWQALKKVTEVFKGDTENLEQIEGKSISLLSREKRLCASNHLKEFLENSSQYLLKIRTDKYPFPPLRWYAIQATLNHMKENPRIFFTPFTDNELSLFERIRNNHHIQSKIQSYTNYSRWEEKYNLPAFKKDVIRPEEYPLEDYLNLWLQEKSPYEIKKIERVSYRSSWSDSDDDYGYHYRNEEWEAEENARWYKSYDDVYCPD